jgi:hypothetical protein
LKKVFKSHLKEIKKKIEKENNRGECNPSTLRRIPDDSILQQSIIRKFPRQTPEIFSWLVTISSSKY